MLSPDRTDFENGDDDGDDEIASCLDDVLIKVTNVDPVTESRQVLPHVSD